MKERIIQFLTQHGLSSTRFADEIGVQRSSVSHLLSGRNKPSFDFIEKMLTSYPDLNAEWLITGKGSMLKSNEIPIKGTPDLLISPTLSKSKAIDDEKKQVENEKKAIPGPDTSVYSVSNKLTDSDKGMVERIVVLFNNGLFKEYLPG